MRTVLVVDDTAKIRRLVRWTLEAAGFGVIEAEDGIEGWGLLRAECPDVIVLDVMMAGPSGLEVCRAIRADPEFRAVPVVILTADARAETEADAWAAGASAFVTKPFSPNRLCELVESLASHPSLPAQ